MNLGNDLDTRIHIVTRSSVSGNILEVSKNKKGKVTSFYTKDKSIKLGNIFMGKDGGEVIRVKLTKRDD